MKKMSRRRAKRHFLKKQVPAAGFCLLYLGCPILVLAAPTGGVVTAGSASISSSGVTTTINQASNKAAINWQSFGIAKGETVNFVQPSASSIALNRVIGSDASAIYGTLSANGQVFLVNPNGILFAPGAQVNVAGLVASTLNISDSDFLNGNYRFSKDGKAGSVVNQGNITANNGYVAFLGPQVKNEGIVAAKVIGMTAGDKVSLDFNGDNLLKLTVDTVAAGANASNSGSLLADGGTVLMSTGTKDALLSTVVNNSGLIQARTVNNISGTIILEGGSANIGGTLDASAPNGGDGGFIETSGAHVTMAPDLHVTTVASQGQTGTWLIDPTDYTIGTGATTTNYWNNVGLGTALGSSNIIVQTDNLSGSDSGDINVLAPVSWSANKLTLSAYRNINIGSTLTATGTSSLAMTSGTGGSGTVDYGLTASGFAGKVNFGARSGSGFLTINGNDYSVITSLGAAGSTSKTDLQGINGDLTGKYYLGADINASSTSAWNSGAGFMPIGNYGDEFSGVFDGGGHTISGLTINRPTAYSVGLFGNTSGGELGNLSLVKAGISGNKYAGSLAGEVTNTQITKTSATAFVKVVDTVGGGAAGGLVGSNGGNISNSYANGSVTGNTQSVNAGGLAGNNSGSISSSYANGSVLGIGDAGGLVGSNTGSISNSYATGNVTGNSSNPQFSAGGLVGKNNGSISSSYATGMVSGSRVGGLVGAKLVSGSTTTSYWDKDTSGMTTSVGGSGRTTTELMSGLPTGFSSDVWGIIPGTSYPYLKWSHPTTPQVVSGFVKDASGATQAGQTVQTLGNGNLVGSTSSGANGFYYMLLDNNSIANNAAALSYVNASGSAAKYATAVNQSLTGFDITADRVTATSGGALDVTVLLALAKGSNTDNTLYTKDGSLLTVNKDLYVTAGGNVSQTGALDLKVNGATNVNAGANDISLNNASNDFIGAVTLTGNNVTLRDTNALALGASIIGGDLNVTAGGNVTQTGALAVSGATTVNAGGNDITLNNTNNDFTGAVTLVGNNVTLRDTNALALGASIIGGDLNVTAGGNVTQAGALAVNSTTSVNAGGNDITLNNAGNDFSGPVNLTGNNVTLRDTNALTLGAITAPASLTLTAGGTITTNNAISTALFDLKGGDWVQINATLPTFSATDFRISGGSFLRALGGDGSSGSPYLISEIYGLQGAGSTSLLGKSFSLANDIDASGTSAWNSGAGFKPIGTDYYTTFKGAFDGGGHTISGLSINRTGSSHVGLFGYAKSNKPIANLSLVNANITGAAYVGILAGEIEGNQISNVSVTGSVTGSGDCVGGLVAMQNSGSISNSYATASVNGGTQHVGGLVGYNSGAISNSYASGSVTGSGKSIGGLAGNQAVNGSISNSYATGSVNGSGQYVGGLLGRNLNGGTISSSYASGSVTGGAQVGGLVGYNLGAAPTNSYWDTQTSGQATSAGGTGLTTAQMKDAANYITWDTAAVWYLNGSQTAPFLRSFLTPLTVSADSATKVYDGNAAATFNNITYTPASGSFDAAKVGGTLVGSGKNVGEHGLTGLYTTSQQGYLISYDSNSTLTITPRALTASVTAADKVYDGTAEATLTGGITLGNLIGSDAVSAAYSSGAFADKHVGTNKTVTLDGITLDGADAGNYSLAADSVTSSASITPKTLTITAMTDSKVYDGSTSSSAGPTYSGLVDMYDTIGGLSQAFASKNVLGAGNSTLNVAGYTINDGNNGQNYSVITQSATGTITPKALTAALTGTAEKIYDGTTAATLTNASFDLFGLIAGDVVSATGTSASYADKNVNTLITVTATGLSISGADAGNYTISGDAAGNIGVITQRALTGSVTAASKVYDRTTIAAIDAGISLGNLIDGDTVSASHAGGVFSDWNVGDNKTVILSGISLTGADAGNYSLASTGIASNASITPATLTLTALGTVQKVYDGTTTAMVWAGNQPTLQGSFAGDNVALTFGNSSATYDNKNVGDNKTVTLSGLTLGGTDAGNYQLASASISGNVGKITPAALTITASANSKVYDGTTSAAATPTISGLMAGDSVSGLAQVYADKNAGSGKTLSVNGYILNDGNSGGNYTVTLQDNASGIITPAQLIYTAATVSREQDKDTPLLSGSIGGIASGDSLAAVTSGSLTWLTTATKSSPAGRYAITGSGLSVIDGNYLADILQAPGNAMALTVRAQRGGAGYQDLLPWIVQANHANGNRPPEGIGATAGNDASAPAVRYAARYAAGEASSGNIDGGAVFGLPLRIVGSGVNVGGHRTVAPLLQISTQEERKPHAL